MHWPGVLEPRGTWFDPHGRPGKVWCHASLHVICRDDIERSAPSFGLGCEFKAPVQGRDTHLLCMLKPYIGDLIGNI